VKYLLLLYGDAVAEAAMTADDRRAMVEEHIRFGRSLDERNARVLGEALGEASGARTISFSNGGVPIVTDGPFLEAKESLGGFYVLDCEGPDEAIELAKGLPRSPGLVAELRPIVDA
jgi:hypothetical protein